MAINSPPPRDSDKCACTECENSWWYFLIPEFLKCGKQSREEENGPEQRISYTKRDIFDEESEDDIQALHSDPAGSWMAKNAISPDTKNGQNKKSVQNDRSVILGAPKSSGSRKSAHGKEEKRRKEDKQEKKKDQHEKKEDKPEKKEDKRLSTYKFEITRPAENEANDCFIFGHENSCEQRPQEFIPRYHIPDMSLIQDTAGGRKTKKNASRIEKQGKRKRNVSKLPDNASMNNSKRSGKSGKVVGSDLESSQGSVQGGKRRDRLKSLEKKTNLSLKELQPLKLSSSNSSIPASIPNNYEGSGYKETFPRSPESARGSKAENDLTLSIETLEKVNQSNLFSPESSMKNGLSLSKLTSLEEDNKRIVFNMTELMKKYDLTPRMLQEENETASITFMDVLDESSPLVFSGITSYIPGGSSGRQTREVFRGLSSFRLDTFCNEGDEEQFHDEGDLALGESSHGGYGHVPDEDDLTLGECSHGGYGHVLDEDDLTLGESSRGGYGHVPDEDDLTLGESARGGYGHAPGEDDLTLGERSPSFKPKSCVKHNPASFASRTVSFPALVDQHSNQFTTAYRKKLSVFRREFSPHCFHSVTPLGSAGGTAAFYKLELNLETIQTPGILPDAFIGKDLAHASDEIEFYEKLHEISQDSTKWKEFMTDFCFFHAGVVELPITIATKSAATLSNERTILVLENMKSGMHSFRLLDIKMGYTTGVSGWKGKSSLHAWKNKKIDDNSNSRYEGSRLEGVVGAGHMFDSYVEAAMQGDSFKSLLGEDRLKKFIMQNMSWSQIFPLIFDIRINDEMPFPHAERYMHRCLLDLYQKMCKFVAILYESSPQQQWIGSSIAIAFDAKPIAQTENRTVLKAFDWGRSAIETKEDYLNLSTSQKKERDRYWQEYFKGALNLSWELGRYAYNRATSPKWEAIYFELANFSTGEVPRLGLFRDLKTVVSADVRLVANTTELDKDTKKIDSKASWLDIRLDDDGTNFRLEITHLNLSPEMNDMMRKKKPQDWILWAIAFENTSDAERYFKFVVKHNNNRNAEIRKRSNNKNRAGSSNVSMMNSTMGSFADDTKNINISGRVFPQPSRIFSSLHEFNGKPNNFYFSRAKITNMKDLDLPKNSFHNHLKFSPDLDLVLPPDKDSAFNEILPAGMVKCSSHNIKHLITKDDRLPDASRGKK